MAMKKSIGRTPAHIDVAATVPFAFTKTFSTPTPVLDSYRFLREAMLAILNCCCLGFFTLLYSVNQSEVPKFDVNISQT